MYTKLVFSFRHLLNHLLVPLYCKGSVVLILVHRPKKKKKHIQKPLGNENLAHIKYGLFFVEKKK